jgi:hypothetical protein
MTALAPTNSSPIVYLSAPPDSPTRAQGRVLLFARLAWAFLFGSFLFLFAAGLPSAWARLLTMSESTRQMLSQGGLSPQLAAVYLLSTDVATIAAFGAIAFLIVWRRSDDWMVMLTSLMLVGTAILYTVPASEAPVSLWFIACAFALAEIFQAAFLYLFPNGKFFPRWLGILLIPMFIWRPLIWGLVYVPNYRAQFRSIENYGTLRQDTFDTLLMVALLLIGVIAQVVRYRKISGAVERQQSKWLLLGVIGALAVTGFYVFAVNAFGILEHSTPEAFLARVIGRTLRQFALFLLPLTLAFSVLRYQLWDIDIYIRRTLIYFPLIAVLTGVFVLMLTLTQRLFVAVTGASSPLATVVSLLVGFVVFDPLRRTLKKTVDQRFRKTLDPAARITKFGDQVQQRLSAVRANQIVRRFGEEAVHAFGAQSGAAYGNENGALTLLSTFGNWQNEPVLGVLLTHEGTCYGSIALGARQEGRGYGRAEMRALERTANTIALAIAQDRRAG